MARIVLPLLLPGIWLAYSTDAFVQPVVFSPSRTVVRFRAMPAVSPRGQHVRQRFLRLSAPVAPGSVRVVSPVPITPLATSPSVKAPPDMYQNAVSVGEKKAALPAGKTLIMGLVSGCHIAMGALLALTVGGNCPGLAASNPGLQKIVFGAFGRQPHPTFNIGCCCLSVRLFVPQCLRCCEPAFFSREAYLKAVRVRADAARLPGCSCNSTIGSPVRVISVMMPPICVS